jgi:hypothetical protein
MTHTNSISTSNPNCKIRHGRLTLRREDYNTIYVKDKGKEVPLQAWGGPEGFEEGKVPRFLDNGAGWW